MNLDELHKVMKGDMTIDQACEGMTDDFEIGHVSHRADGDWRKVAQGKWVPVKAGGGQGQMGAKKEDGAGKPQAGKATQEELDTYKEIVRQFAKNKNPMTEKIMNMAKEHLMKSRGVSAEQIAKIGSDVFWENDKAGQQGEKKPDSQGDKNVLTSADDVNWDIIEQVQKEAYKANKTHGVPEMMEKYDITQIQKFANQNVDTGFANVDGIRGYLKKKAGLPGGVDLNVASKELAKFNNWQNARNIWRRYENKELDVDETGHFYVPEPAKPKAEGNAPAKKSAFESFREKEGWKTDNEADRKRDYSLFLKSMRQADFDKYASQNQGDPDYDSEAVKKERETREWYDKAYSSDAAPRLTRDTKIRLSRIKR